jgi:hypothetical protein
MSRSWDKIRSRTFHGCRSGTCDFSGIHSSRVAVQRLPITANSTFSRSCSDKRPRKRRVRDHRQRILSDNRLLSHTRNSHHRDMGLTRSHPFIDMSPNPRIQAKPAATPVTLVASALACAGPESTDLLTHQVRPLRAAGNASVAERRLSSVGKRLPPGSRRHSASDGVVSPVESSRCTTRVTLWSSPRGPDNPNVTLAKHEHLDDDPDLPDTSSNRWIQAGRKQGGHATNEQTVRCGGCRRRLRFRWSPGLRR